MSLPVYKVLIVDDEPPARDVLRRYIQNMPMLYLAGECSNALQVIPFLHSQPVDVMFLDIRMPQLNGLELIGTLDQPPKIIFTTAYEEYAVRSYELNITDYLLKPIQFERFVKAVNKAIPTVSSQSVGTQFMSSKAAMSTENDSFLYFRSDRKMVKIMLKDILYIESLKDYVKIVTEKGQVITKYSMAALEVMLPALDFVRVHRSYIVALMKIRSYTASHVQLQDNELPIGKLYQREVFRALEADKLH